MDFAPVSTDPFVDATDGLTVQSVTLDELAIRLDHLRQEHGDLDTAIAALNTQSCPDQLAAARLKKRKLRLKDDIARLETMLIPDIIA